MASDGHQLLGGIKLTNTTEATESGQGCMVSRGGAYFSKSLRSASTVFGRRGEFGSVRAQSGVVLCSPQVSTTAAQYGLTSTLRALQLHADRLNVQTLTPTTTQAELTVEAAGNDWTVQAGDFVQVYRNAANPLNQGLFAVKAYFDSRTDSVLVLEGVVTGHLSFLDSANSTVLTAQPDAGGFVVPVHLSAVNPRTDTGLFQQGSGTSAATWRYSDLGGTGTFTGTLTTVAIVSQDIVVGTVDYQLPGTVHTYFVTAVNTTGRSVLLPAAPIEGQRHKIVRTAAVGESVQLKPGNGSHSIQSQAAGDPWPLPLGVQWDSIVVTFRTSNSPSGTGSTWVVGS